MRGKKFLFALGLLLAGIVGLMVTGREAGEAVLAYAPLPKPNASSTIFLPFVSQTYTTTPAPLWRFGIDKLRRALTEYDTQDVAHLRLGWYVDFGISGAPVSALGIKEYMPTVRVKQLKDLGNGTPVSCCITCTTYLNSYTISPATSTIQSTAIARPGMTWIIGNEMDRIDWGNTNSANGLLWCASQDEMLPEMYATVYHDIRELILAADPTAKFAIGALVQASPLRIQYLDRMWHAYQTQYATTMPIDVWNIHVYVFNETPCSVDPANCWGADVPTGFAGAPGYLQYKIRDHKDFTLAWQMIVNLRTWMQQHGQQNKPLITTEYGVLFDHWVWDIANPPVTNPIFTPTAIRDSFMYPSFNAFLNQTSATIGMPADGNRLMQRWAWWSMDYDEGFCEQNPDPPYNWAYYQHNSSNLFGSGLGIANPPSGCVPPTKGATAFHSFWTQYVWALPAGAAQPYAPVSAPVARSQEASTAPAMKNLAPAAMCPADTALRAQIVNDLARRGAAGDRSTAAMLSKFTAGARVCASSSVR